MNFDFTHFYIKRVQVICIILFFNGIGLTAFPQLKIGGKPTTLNPNAIFELESATRGLLLSRVPLSALSNPSPMQQHVKGMIVYNSDGALAEGFYYNDGSKWNKLSSSESTNTNIYNSDGQLSNLRKVNLNSFNLLFEGTGNIGIGMESDPSYKLHVNGSIASTSGYYNLSDSRFKKNILPLESSLDKLTKLNGVTFNWNQEIDPTKKLDSKTHIGFIAQDIEKVFPQVVTTATDEMKTKTVAYNDLIPVLVEAIKELKNENSELKMLLLSKINVINTKLMEEVEKLEALSTKVEVSRQTSNHK